MNHDGLAKSRRNFLKKSAAGLVGAAVLPSLAVAEEAPKKVKVVSRPLGKTGITLPIISMGVMNADNPKLVEAALDSGLVHLDTAWFYQGGRNEEMVGSVMKNRKRDSVVISTKIWEPRDRSTGLFPKEATAETFLEKFNTSLKRLQMDYVDILYLHSISEKEAVMFEPYLEAMVNLKKQGKVRHLGVSTHRNEPTVLRAAADSKVFEIVLTSYNFRMTNLKEVESAIEYAASKGLGIVAMKTQAGLYWDGKEKQRPINMKAALKWALQNKNVHTAIPGFTTFDQLELDVSVMADLALTAQEKADLVPPKDLEVSAGLYCQQCGQCLNQCPKGLEIPTMMRSYMYAYGYKNLEQAKQTLELTESKGNPCTQCAVCTVNCAMQFDIKNRVTDIARLRDVPGDFLA